MVIMMIFAYAKTFLHKSTCLFYVHRFFHEYLSAHKNVRLSSNLIQLLALKYLLYYSLNCYRQDKVNTNRYMIYLKVFFSVKSFYKEQIKQGNRYHDVFSQILLYLKAEI